MPPRKKATAKPLTRPAPNPEAYSQCRALGHEWRHRPAHRYVNSTMIVQVSQCPDCTTIRTRYITNSGLIPRPARYEHPDGYATHGDAKKTMQQWRFTLVTRLFDDIAQLNTQTESTAS